MILDNPFHVLGLPADCTTKELNGRRSRAEAYLRVRKALEFDEDLYLSARCHRNSATLERAVTQLHDRRQRIQHGLFWFTRAGTLSAHALRLLARGKKRAAFEVLERIESRPVNATTASDLNNFGTLSLLLGLDPPDGERRSRNDWIQRGLRAKARLVGQLSEPQLTQFCALLGDELAARDPKAVVEGFGESLKRSIEEAELYSVQVPGRNLVKALEAGGPRLEPIKAELGSTVREEIERAIKACEASRKRNPSAANDAARELQAVLEVQLPALADATSADDYLYRSLADRAAETLVSTTTVYFNHHAELDGISLELIVQLLPIGEYAAEIACGETARKRARDDVATLRRMAKTQRAKAQFAPAFAAMTEWFAACDVLGEDEDAPPFKLETFVETSLDPKHRPGKTIVAPLKTLNAPDSPLSADSGSGESEAVAMNSNVCHRLLMLAIRAYNASGGQYGGEEILTRIANVFVGATGARQGRVTRFPVDDACWERLRENLRILRSNQAVAEASASRSGCAGTVAALLLLVFAAIIVIPGMAGADPQRPTVEAPLEAIQEAREERERRLEALEAANAMMLDRVQALGAGRERDAARIRELETALREADEAVRTELAGIRDAAARDREEIRRETGENLAEVRDAAARDREVIRRETGGNLAEVYDEGRAEVARLRAETESGVTGLGRETTENRAGLVEETALRMRGDRRGVWYAGGVLTLAALGVGLLWRWNRRETGRIGKRFDRSVSGLQGFLEEAGEQSAKTLAALEELASQPAEAAEPDHKLVLLMCNEINRMENNLRHMDSAARGHRKLLGVVRRMKENLVARGYEITELRGQRYDEGLAIGADDWITDESLEPGRKVISWVKTPEVRFRGRIVQAANVQVATGP